MNSWFRRTAKRVDWSRRKSACAKWSARLACVPGNPYALQIKHLCDVARGVAAPLISAADGTATLRATLAVAEAARTGATVDIETA